MTSPAAPARHRVVARDGTSIAWHAYRDAADDAEVAARPAVILTNGLGTTPNFWSHLVEALAPRHRVVHWDYRGHGESEVARSNDYSVATQADDLARVTEAVQAAGGSTSPAVHIGFSMGVTVVLELYRRRPDLVRALVLVAGGADHPYAASPAFRLPGAGALLRAGVGALSPVVPRLAPIARRASRSRALFPLGQRIGALTPSAPRHELEHFFRSVGAMDLGAYWSTLRALLLAHASDVLPTVRVPVLVVAPAHDIMAPERDLGRLRDEIPGAEWLRIPGTGHAVLLEAGDAVAAGVLGFLRGLR